MAQGDVKWFANYELKANGGISFNLATDTIKLGIVDNTIIPGLSTADPRWGSGGSTDFSANQVPTGAAYTGPITLTSTTWLRSGAVDTFNASNIVIALDVGTGFTNGYFGIIYDDSVGGKYCIGWVDLGGPKAINAAPLNINWNAAGILQATAS